VGREAAVFLHPAPFHHVIGLVRESSVGRFHCCRIKIHRLFAEFDVDPAALIAADKLELVTAESRKHSVKSWIALVTIFLKRDTLRARGAGVFRYNPFRRRLACRQQYSKE